METSFDKFKKKYYSNTLAATSDVDEYHSYSVSGIEKTINLVALSMSIAIFVFQEIRCLSINIKLENNEINTYALNLNKNISP